MVRKGQGNDTTDIELQVHAETAKAWKVSDDGVAANAKWLAKAQAEQGDRKGPSTFEFTVPAWIATENGWV